jgi:hypothetical protein
MNPTAKTGGLWLYSPHPFGSRHAHDRPHNFSSGGDVNRPNNIRMFSVASWDTPRLGWGPAVGLHYPEKGSPVEFSPR